MARNKILTFSDIHFGINLNSVLKLEIAAKTIDFIIEQQFVYLMVIGLTTEKL